MTEFNEKQLEILQVAEQLFAEEGFDGTSIRDIAKKANINIAMISYYFGSKEKMLEALVLNRISDMRLQLESLYNENIPPFAKVDKMVELYINRINKNRCIYQILHFEFSTKKRELNFDGFNEMKKNNLETFKNIIKEGQDSGEFQQDINVDLLPPIIMGTYFQFHMNKPFYLEILDLKTEEEYQNYIATTLTQHIQTTIKAHLVYAN
ncbi:TetR family transcriptional regulator [Flavobacterium paronense]|uniref:TetR/AcrR family transcriptional regulator n=1 Tax=Flavobacterium paronense TaxID=1392775 RepID=A0ABV5GA67_9FLAO|nr:TetR family transcriptional regulator [Flavobacterium paronense]MDN3677349.1 TetR family transcriptional regulator [Flavobacterium paronense]